MQLTFTWLAIVKNIQILFAIFWRGCFFWLLKRGSILWFNYKFVWEFLWPFSIYRTTMLLLYKYMHYCIYKRRNIENPDYVFKKCIFCLLIQINLNDRNILYIGQISWVIYIFTCNCSIQSFWPGLALFTGINLNTWSVDWTDLK